eukprot:Skav211925  [mRNA]  locus=scaffold1086:114008:122082:+ [translate_table: standard]
MAVYSIKPAPEIGPDGHLFSEQEDTKLKPGFGQSEANLARDYNDEVAAAAIRALGDFGQEGTNGARGLRAKHMAAVASGLNRNSEVCVAAATALAQFGPAALPYAETLATCLQRHLDEASKAAVLAALGAVGAEQHADLLVVARWQVVVSGGRPSGPSGPSGLRAENQGPTPNQSPTPGPSFERCQLPPETDEVTCHSLRFRPISWDVDGTRVTSHNLCPSEIASEEQLENKSMAVSAAACQALGKLSAGVPEASRIAQKMKQPGTRFAAVSALGNLGQEADEVAELLGDDGDDDSESTSGCDSSPHEVGKAPERAGGRIEGQVLRSEVLDRPGRDRPGAQWDPGMETPLDMDLHERRVLKNGWDASDRKACQCIAAIGATDVMDNLPDLFHDEAPSVRQAALDALATFPDVGKTLGPRRLELRRGMDVWSTGTYSSQVFKCISDEYGCVRAAAMRCLASMDSVGQCYASTIAGELTSQDPESRAAACETLGKLGDYGAAFAEDIEMCQNDEIPMVRAAAAYSLVQLGVKVSRGIENGNL